MRRNTDRVATPVISYRWHVDRRAAVPADDILPVLAIPFRAANPASVQRRAIAVRFLDDQKSHRLIPGVERVQVQSTVLNLTDRDAHFIAHCRNGPCRGWSGVRTRINK